MEKQKTKISLGKKVLVGCGVLVILLVLVGRSGSDSQTTSRSTNPINKTATTDTMSISGDLSSDITSGWSYSESEDKMTSKKITTASLIANEELEFDFPYNGGSTATFTIRKKNGALDMFLSVSKGQFNSTFDGGQINIRFDSARAKKYSFSGSSDASTDIIFLNSTRDILSKIKASEKMLLEAEFFNEGNRQIEFDVKGLRWE